MSNRNMKALMDAIWDRPGVSQTYRRTRWVRNQDGGLAGIPGQPAPAAVAMRKKHQDKIRRWIGK